MKQRFITERKPAESGNPPIEYHDPEAGGLTSADYQKAHLELHVGDYERVGQLLESQLELQSDEFAGTEEQSGLWDGFLTQLQEAHASFSDAMGTYLNDYEATESPSYKPVSQATYQLHQAIFGSDLFRFFDETGNEIDSDLRIFAFYTMEARDRYLSMGEEGSLKTLREARDHQISIRKAVKRGGASQAELDSATDNYKVSCLSRN